MKHLIIIPLFLISQIYTQNTMAQDLDLDEINERNQTRIENEYSQTRKNNFKNSRVGRVIESLKFKNSSIPKVRKFNKTEKSQINLIKCVDDIIQENKGAYAAPKVAQEIMMMAMEGDVLSKDTNKLADVTQYCKDVSNDLYSYKGKAIDKVELLKSVSDLSEYSEALKKTKKFVYNLTKRSKSSCKVSAISAEAGFGFAVGAGAVKIKCIHTHGVVKNYIGLSLDGGAGFGFAVRLKAENLKGSEVNANDALASYSIHHFTFSEYISNGKNVVFTKNNNEQKAIGLYGSFDQITGGAGIRFFNGKRRWQVLLDPLNKK